MARFSPLLLLLPLLAFGGCRADLTAMDAMATIMRHPLMQEETGNWTEDVRRLLLVIQSNSTLLQAFLNDSQSQGFAGRAAETLDRIGYDFPCSAGSFNTTPATSVHQLTPADVKVVGAVGDSLSAGSGVHALTPLGILLSFRGSVFSIGGDLNYRWQPTLPNILRKFNPNLRGFARGFLKRNAGFDAAVPGAKSEDMLKQTFDLIDRIKADTQIDFQRDWKVVTLFVGGNDLCAYCKNPRYYTPAMYIANIKRALDLLHQELPRTFVNVVNVLDVSQIRSLTRGLACTVLHYFECRCGAYTQPPAQLREVVLQYQRNLSALVDSGVYDDRDDFTVVLQPFLENTKVPLRSDGKADLRYFAPDCFHLSALGQARAAQALWNNMIEPVGAKRTDWHIGEPVECPDPARPFFYTRKNSG